jgi:hypothetical protein
MAAVDNKELLKDADELITITIKKKDIISVANALTAGRRLNKWERRKLVANLQNATGLTLYDKNNVKEICERKVRQKKKYSEKEKSSITAVTESVINIGDKLDTPLLNTKHVMSNLHSHIIIGCGEISNYYFHSLTQKPGYVVQGIVDVDTNRCKLLANKINKIQSEKYGKHIVCAIAASLDELFAEQKFIGGLPTVLNLTPAECHYEINHEVLQKYKCHLFSEKPLASTFAQGVELVELAKHNNLKLTVAPVICYGMYIFLKILSLGFHLTIAMISKTFFSITITL